MEMDQLNRLVSKKNYIAGIAILEKQQQTNRGPYLTLSYLFFFFFFCYSLIIVIPIFHFNGVCAVNEIRHFMYPSANY